MKRRKYILAPTSHIYCIFMGNTCTLLIHKHKSASRIRLGGAPGHIELTEDKHPLANRIL